VKSETDISSYDNSWYRPGRSLTVRLLWYVTNSLFFINPLNLSSKVKIILLRSFGAKIGKGVRINPSVNIKYPWRLEVGDYSWIGEKSWIDNLDDVKIGSNCCLSQGSMLLTGNHDYKKSAFDLVIKSITIEDGVWIGAKSIVCPGVICKSHAILVVGSVATRSLDSYGIYRGNPATKIKNRAINEF